MHDEEDDQRDYYMNDEEDDLRDYYMYDEEDDLRDYYMYDEEDYSQNYNFDEDDLRGFYTVMYIFQCVLLTMSFLGNGCIIAIMSNKKNRKHVTSPMFIALAVSDTLITIIGPLERFLSMFSIAYFKWTKYESLLTSVIISSTVQISSWLLVLITIDRAVCVAIPHKVHKIFSMKRVIAFIAIIYLFFPLINGIYIFATSAVYVNVDGQFDSYFYKELHADLFGWIEMLFKFLIPLAIILLSNTIILYKIIARSIPTSSGGSNSRSRSVTKNVIMVCIVFVVTLSPRQIYNWLVKEKLFSNNIKLVDIFEYFQNCNAALNFYVYVLSGSKFRNDFIELIRNFSPAFCIKRCCKIESSTDVSNRRT